MPVIIVHGTHDSGKTTVIEGLLPRLVSKGYTIAVVKDIHIEGFSIDTEGKDTWRHAGAGASIVCVRGLAETSFITRAAMTLEDILDIIDHRVDLVIAEGFKTTRGSRVIAARDLADLDATRTSCDPGDEILAIGGIVAGVSPGEIDARGSIVLRDHAAFDALADRLEGLAKKGRLARHRLRMPLEDRGCTLTIDGTAVHMKPYVADTLRNILVSTTASLLWNTWEPVSTIGATMDRAGDGAPLAASLRVSINDKALTLKDFVQTSIGETLLGYLRTLAMPGDVTIDSAGAVSVLVS